MKTLLLLLLCPVLLLRLDAKEMIPPSLVTPQWNNLGVGIDGYIYTIVAQGNDIYVGGDFQDAAGIPDADYIARWDGCDWHTVVPGIDGIVYTLIFNGNTMYAGGYFSGHVAKWAGGVWTVLAGINDNVLAVGVNTSGVYAAGYFTDASGNSDADGIARWNGSSWVAMGTGIELLDIFIDIATLGNDVYIGGYFNNAGGVPNTQNIARWDGSTWNSVGGGLDQFVTTVKTFGADIYVAGDFHNAGGNPNADEIAMWDGNTWNNVGLSPNFIDWPYRISISQDYIYTSSSGFGSSDPEMYKYDFQNDTWDYYPPTNNYAYSLIQAGSDLYMGSYSIWRWGEPGPTITISGIQNSICQDAAPISLPTTQSGYQGNWSGTGVSNNTFNPSGSLGWYTLTFTPNPGQCVSPTNFQIQVYLNPITLNLPASICELSPPLSLTPFQNGFSGNWSGPGVSNNMFNPLGLWGNNTLTFTPTPGQCANISTDVILVFQAIIPIISGIPASVCEDNDPVSLPTPLNGVEGAWSGEGVTNNIFYPEGLNGTITLTFIPIAGICGESVSTSIQVNPLVNISISGIPDSLCQLTPSISLPTSQSNIQGNWSGPGVNNNIFNPSGQNGIVVLTFTPVATACANSTTTSVLVYFYLPIISGVPDSVCENIPPFSLPVTQSGFTGNWSGNGVSNNFFNPIGINNNNQLTFTPNIGQCAIPVEQDIYVEPSITPSIAGIPFSICSQSAPIELPDIQEGIEGDWSGLGVTDNTFDPNGMIGEIILTFFPESWQCASLTNTTITVQDPIIPSISGIPSFLCESAAPQLLPTTQSGVTGNWSGPGVTNNYLNPSGQNGNVVLTFTPYASECAVSNTWNVIVDTSFIPALSGLPTAVCQSDSQIPLSSVQTGFIGTWSGPGISNDTFNPRGLTGMVQLTFNPNANQCAVPAEGNILVNTPTHLVFSLPDSLCQKDEPVELSQFQDSIPGVWVGPGIENNFFNPDSQSGNVVLFFLADNGACEDTASDQIYVQTLPSATNLYVECDSTTNTYTVSFDITGGNPEGYLVDGIPALTGNFISESYPFSESYYSFILEDGSDCGPVSILGSNSCVCFSDAGTMNFNGAPLRICKGPELTVAYNSDGHLDPDDLLLFVLHDNAGNQLGNIYSVNDHPVFSFVPGMLTGHTYYISSVAGTNNGSGTIDFNDPCLSVSQGVPVIFFECEADVQNVDPVSLDRIPFNQPFNEETDGDQNTTGGNGNNGKMQTNHIPNTLSTNNDLDEQWASILNDPNAIIKELNMYDLYGRLVYNEKNIPGNSFLFNWKSNIQSSKMAPGIYVFTLEVEKGNGEIIRIQGCRVNVRSN